MTKRVLSVGQCERDQAAMTRFLQATFPVSIETSATSAETLDWLRKQSCDLVLINRKLDILAAHIGRVIPSSPPLMDATASVVDSAETALHVLQGGASARPETEENGQGQGANGSLRPPLPLPCLLLNNLTFPRPFAPRFEDVTPCNKGVRNA